MSLDRVQPLKLEDPATGGEEVDAFPTGVDAQHDYYEGAGLVLNDATHRDESTVIDRAGADMMFRDTNNPGGYTLTQLALSGGGASDFNQLVLETDGKLVYIGDGDIVLRSV